ncbi:DUF1127 domain-containing protein [Roseovarius sp.]|jgi:uncharacterized protein YjiS (DUF1127 family)
MPLLSLSRAAQGARPRPLLALRLMLSLHRQRRSLARLDDRALADIGLDRDTAQTESRRPLWDIPAHWRNS